jgi:hypothetical protein
MRNSALISIGRWRNTYARERRQKLREGACDWNLAAWTKSKKIAVTRAA